MREPQRVIPPSVNVLILTLDGIESRLSTFLPNGYEQTFVASSELNYSLNGTPLVDGIAYESKRVLTIGAVCTAQNKTALLQIFQRSERKRRTQAAGFGIIVHDLIGSVVEDVSRTRALANGATVLPLAGGGCEYFAQFEYQLYEPKVVPTGNGILTHQVNFVLKELRKVAA